MAEYRESAPGGKLEKIPSQLTYDPKTFAKKFYESDQYEKARERYFNSKHWSLNPAKIDEEKQELFEESETAKNAMIDFGRYSCQLKYSVQHIPEKAIGPIAKYLEFIQKVREPRRKSGEEIQRDEDRRYHLHEEAADALVEAGVAKSTKLARALVRLMAISEGLDTFENALRPDAKRAEIIAKNQTNF